MPEDSHLQWKSLPCVLCDGIISRSRIRGAVQSSNNLFTPTSVAKEVTGSAQLVGKQPIKVSEREFLCIRASKQKARRSCNDNSYGTGRVCFLLKLQWLHKASPLSLAVIKQVLHLTESCFLLINTTWKPKCYLSLWCTYGCFGANQS